MNSLTDQQLLRDYTQARSEAAFAELVRRHVDFVYSAARRMVCDAHLAEDVTQSVFVAVAQNARRLTDHPVLSGWLHRTAQNLAANTVRSEVRHRARQQEAAAMNETFATEPDTIWEHIAPQLDAALGALSHEDRDALLLRYFQRKSAREMAQTLGVSEEAAQKRVTRAVERLREFFAKRGVAVGASGLVIAISAHAVQAAPVGLTTAITTASLAATVTAAVVATHTTMSGINIKAIAAVIAGTLAAGSGTYFVQQRETNRLRSENQGLIAQQEKLASERDTALSSAIANNDDLERLRKDRGDLLRLRGEVGALRKQAKELENLREENHQLRADLSKTSQSSQQSENNSEADPQRQVRMAKINDAKLLAFGLFMYSSDHEGQLPTSLDTTSRYLSSATPAFTQTNQFELLVQGTLTNITNPSSIIIVREKEAWQLKGMWYKAYAFADGHAELHTQPDGDFEAWERDRLIQPPAIGK